MSQTKVKSGLISDQSITASKLDVTGNGNSGEVLASAGDGSFVWTSGIATELYTDNAIAALVDSAPGALDTLNELAAALGDDANFAGTVTTALAAKVDGTGTANYISKWSDSDTLANSLIYDDGTNVGIGTSNPAEKLHIQTGTNGGYATIKTAFASDNFKLRMGVGADAAGDYSEISTSNFGGNLILSADEGNTKGASVMAFRVDGSEKMRIDSSGNVGIGTSSIGTQGKLYIVANGISEDVKIGLSPTNSSGGPNPLAQIGATANGTYGSELYFTTRSTGGTVSERMRIDSTGDSTFQGNIVFQNTKELQAVDSTGSRKNILFMFSDNNVYLSSPVSGANLIFRGVDYAERMRINSSGNVGIGTSSPTQFVQIGANFQAKKLYVAGSYNFGGVYIGAVNSNTGSTIEFVSHTGVTTSRSFRVGSNTDLYGSDKLVFEISNSTTTFGGLSYSPKMLLNSLGNLHVDGDVIAYSTTISDERLKDNIVTIDNALDKVCELRGVEYDWNASSRAGQHDMGVIAQEVEKVFPFIVREKEMPLVDGNTYKTVDYEKLVGVLIEAVKELKQEIEILKSK